MEVQLSDITVGHHREEKIGSDAQECALPLLHKACFMNERLFVGKRVGDECPSLPEGHSISIRVLHDACVKLGGENALACHLRQPLALVDDWLTGRKLPPDHVFLRCLDILEG